MTMLDTFKTCRAGLACAVLLAAAAPTQAQMIGVCGELRQAGQFGPFDYRTIPAESKYLVEKAHFTTKVETLTSGQEGYLGGDLDYTLRAIPNHPRALLAMTRYAMKTKQEKPPAARFTIQCYFERAMAMAPDDPMPHVLYASYLKQRGKPVEAKKELDTADKMRGNPRGFDLDYNMGILYFDLGETDKAEVAAKRAYALGAPLPALRNKLKAKGRNVDGPPAQ